MKQVESILKGFNKVVAQLEKVCTQNKYQADKNLLDVLAKEMKGWPEGGYSVGQAADGTLHVNGKSGILLYHTKKAYSQPSAGKFYADIVTKDMWENSRVKSKTINSLQSKHKPWKTLW